MTEPAWSLPGGPVRGSLFHLVPTDVQGDALLPPHLLRQRFPGFRSERDQRYVGREHVLAQPVPPLGCTWGEVLFFSPVDSSVLFEAIRQSGRRVPRVRPRRLDAARLDPRRTCIRLMRKDPTGPEAEPADPCDWLPYTTGTLRAVSRVTQAALDRLATLGPNDPLLPWVDVPHILHADPVPLAWFED